MTTPLISPSTSLNPAQRIAVDHGDGPALVLAGAGSGKTRVLTARIARLIEDGHAKPHDIMAVTFTNKAATEMRHRVARALGSDPAGMWIGTFHGLGARFIRMHAEAAGRTREFSIYDEDDSLSLIKRLMERARVSTRDWTPRAVNASISDAKNALVAPDEYAALSQTPLGKAAAAVYQLLDPALREANAVSFDDLLVIPVQLLGRPEIREQWHRRFRYVLVDEYQDTNRAQYEFIHRIAGPTGNVMAVGDDDQAIYGWRGADVRNILDFERGFPNARVVRLEDNYRSTPQILDLANAVIAENRDRRGKTLRATHEGGAPVTLTTCLDERDEADVIADAIERRPREIGLGSIAILYRTNAQSRPLEDALRKRVIPYRLIGAVRFYDRREVKDLVSWLRVIANPKDDEAFRRAVQAPKRGIGDTTLEVLAVEARDAGCGLFERCARGGLPAAIRPAARESLAQVVAVIERLRLLAAEASVDRLLGELIRAIGYAESLKAEGPEGEERLQNVQELITSAAETVVDDGGEVGMRPLDHFLQRATLVSAAD
ncbi:MAG: UvrD-helicase domain-containing protein, partial [Gemmatimonadaceae bacterium]|nr:UvrD-helicase domain-containing protein [Gemmatimonadaceae bacterium]